MSVCGVAQYTSRGDSYAMFAFVPVICSGLSHRLHSEPANGFYAYGALPEAAHIKGFDVCRLTLMIAATRLARSFDFMGMSKLCNIFYLFGFPKCLVGWIKSYIKPDVACGLVVTHTCL
ncbi:hypothetical protein EVAR_82261_1 [Eumeta japonica]|uniref:Uncharacterized protein n=1 Tax=Eumeta variegata TaxID=151549 RepID=A0A4C1VZZ7_EUMVA|nr:hypothetical protein EVAR_82261_1 [Eumeta japonica]